MLTAAAQKHAKLQLERRGTPNAYLRLGINGSGGCAGYSYHIEWADEKRSTDLEFTFDSLKVIVDPKSIILLNNSTLDYETKLVGGGFRFHNPAAISKCGCGESFGVGGDT